MLARTLYLSILALLFSACGGGSSTSAPPVNPPPNVSNSTLYFGYYQEDSTADPNDPTPGIIYVYMPSTDTTFNGEFFFSYVGCAGSYDTGLLNAAKTANMFSGTWNGNIDGNAHDGNFSASTSDNGATYNGNWDRTGGSQNYSFGSAPYICSYTVAGNGTFTLYKIAGSNFSIQVNLADPNKPVFSWTLTAGAVAMKLDVFDQACLTNGGSISGCTMWSDLRYDMGSGLPGSITYTLGPNLAQPLVSGNTYVVTLVTSDVSGNVVDFGSNQFSIP